MEKTQSILNIGSTDNIVGRSRQKAILTHCYMWLSLYGF